MDNTKSKKSSKIKVIIYVCIVLLIITGIVISTIIVSNKNKKKENASSRIDNEKNIVNIDDINVNKEEIFRTFPNLSPYSNSFRLIREFGENEECGTSTGVFKVSPNKDIEIEIIYEKC